MTHALSCRATLARATRYIDGGLCADERARVQGHLRACARCLAAFRADLALARAAHALPRAIAPEGLAQQVAQDSAARRRRELAALHDEPRTAARHPVLVAAALAAVVLAAALGFALGRASQAPQPMASSAPPATSTAGDAAPTERPTEAPVRPPPLPFPQTPAIEAEPAGNGLRRVRR
jgi:anti-sigma factor RsiW